MVKILRNASIRLGYVSMYILVSLCFASCSSDKETLENEQYVTVELSVDSVEDIEQARAVSFKYDSEGKPSFSFGYTRRQTIRGGLRPRYNYYTNVHTTITKEGATPGQRVVIFEGDLEWERDATSRRLTYNGPLKILSSDWQNLKNVQLHAVVGDLKFDKPNTEIQAEYIRLNGQDISNELPVPYAMTTPVVQVKGQKKLTLADPSFAKFKPKGVLVQFVVKNRLSTHLFMPFVYVETSAYSKSLTVDKYGNVTPSNPQVNTPMRADATSNFLQTIKPNNSGHLIAWLPKEDLTKITKVSAIGLGHQATFTRVGGTATDGSLVTYEVEFSEKKQSLDKGELLTDNYGYVVARVLEVGGVLRGQFTPDEIRQYTTKNDLWHLSYYLPIAMSRYITDYLGRGSTEIKDFSFRSTITPGLNESNYFRNSDTGLYGSEAPEGLNDLVKFTRSGELKQADSKFRYVRSTVRTDYSSTMYAVRFINFPEYRVFQRWRLREPVESGFTDTPHASLFNVEVSFLPYDASADNSGEALTEAYWQRNESRVQKVFFGSGYANANIGPVVNDLALLAYYEGNPLGYWANVMGNFVRSAGSVLYGDTWLKRDSNSTIMKTVEDFNWSIVSFQ